MTVDAEKRSQAIKLRRLEIAATLAEWKRLYFAESIERPLADRVTLEAEDAKLALEARQIVDATNEAKAMRRRIENACLLTELLAVLKDRGLTPLVVEANDRVKATVAGLLNEAQKPVPSAGEDGDPLP